MGRLPVATLIQTPLTSFSSKPPPRGTQRCIRAPSHDAGAGPTGGTGGRPCYCTQPALSWGTASTQHVARRCPETATQPPQPPATSALPCAPPPPTHTPGSQLSSAPASRTPGLRRRLRVVQGSRPYPGRAWGEPLTASSLLVGEGPPGAPMLPLRPEAPGGVRLQRTKRLDGH